GDVLVCGDDEDAKKVVLELARAIPGVHGVDAGPLSNSRTVEQLTALLVSLNIRYNVKRAGLRITGLHSGTGFILGSKMKVGVLGHHELVERTVVMTV